MNKHFTLFGLVLLSLAFMRVTVSAEETTPYVGKIVMHNARTHKIEIKTEEHSTGTWRVAKHIMVLRKGERLELSDIWGKTKRVRAWVTKSGIVERIDVLEWK